MIRRLGDLAPDFEMAEVEQRAEQRRGRRHRAAALGHSKGGMLMAQQLRHAGVGLANTILDAGVAQLEAQRQGVDEWAQHPLGALPGVHAAKQHRAEHHIVAAGALRQHLCPGEMEQTGGAHPVFVGRFSQPARQSGIDQRTRFCNLRAIALHIGEPKWRGGFIHIGEHVAEECLVFFRRNSQPGLGNEVAKWQRGGQLVCLPLQTRWISSLINSSVVWSSNR